MESRRSISGAGAAATGDGRTPAITDRDAGAPSLPRMVRLAPIAFIMGENEDDKFANDTERPPHWVVFDGPFALGACQVTVGEFRRFRPDHALDEPDELPVIHVDWHDAVDYCRWLTEQSGRVFRLPSEAEWEFACRADSRTPFAFGNELSIADANFLHDESGARIGPGRRTPAGTYAPNRFGLFDMHGNVCEWVADSWHLDYGGAPADGRPWVEPDGSRRVIRGGAWDYLPRLLRSSWRDWRAAGHQSDNIGFRIASSDPRVLGET